MRYLRGTICSWLIVSAPLLGMTGFAENAVLCWGSDGHVGIEAGECQVRSESACCSSEQDHADHAVCDENESRAGCFDIPLPRGGATAPQHRHGGGESWAKLICTIAPIGLNVADKRVDQSNRSDCPPGRGAAAHLRTVILLA